MTHVFNMTAERKTGANLLEKINNEMQYVQGLGYTVIGIAGDASGDERKARALKQRAEPHLLMADCWAHQV
jgi:hypothetical protein